MLTITVILIVAVFIVMLNNSYAYFESSVEGSCVSLQVGKLDQDLLGKITLEKNETVEIEFIVKNTDSVSSKYQMYYKTDTELSNVVVGYSINSTDLPSGDIEKGEEKIIKLILQNNISKDVVITIGVKGGLFNNTVEDIILEDDEHRIIEMIDDSVYKETILNGTDPVLTDNLIPVLIADDGEVTKADLSKEWYSYEDQEWANAVVLVDTTIGYNNGDIIPESNIESYFVWIPKYSYKLWDLGNYTSLTSLDSTKVHAINVRFGLEDTSDNNEGECTTPGVAGETGNCTVGDYMTHPAFTAFDSNGFWVGKFESGYKGATSTEEAEINLAETNKLIIKPNAYSWRNIAIGNAFKIAYDYLREEESHMMKNTEWGAIAFLQHSNYGSRQSVRVNNNSSYLTGYAAVSEPTCGYNSSTSTSCNLVGNTTSVTLPYNTTIGYTASTTGNITGIYDMSGGAWDYVMGYTAAVSNVGGSSGLASAYGDFFTSNTYEKYYDKYTVNSQTGYSNRILGDATGEMGSFTRVTDLDKVARPRSSWYGDYGRFIDATLPWFVRGSSWMAGVLSGVFAFHCYDGGAAYSDASFHIVLTP